MLNLKPKILYGMIDGIDGTEKIFFYQTFLFIALFVCHYSGGLNLDATGFARICEITSNDGAIAVTLAAHQSIGLKVRPSLSSIPLTNCWLLCNYYIP